MNYEITYQNKLHVGYHIFILLMFGFGFLLLSLFISLKKSALLLYLVLFWFKLFLARFSIALASNFVIPPNSIFLFNFFLVTSFLLCLSILLFFSLLPLLFYYFYDLNLLFSLVGSSEEFPFQPVTGTFYSTIVA